ncbi:MAG TPA: dTDP-4-dehydrorhamnose 3,5-epimerase [Blastocatellia bacterium]|nr:dTDP-4-dehydrorhamnose 3,5-epimerase [Blastocatellia bacterium]
MKKIETRIPGVFLIEPLVLEDERGLFFETYHEQKFAALGINDRFVQDNHSRSVRGTVRGLHYQLTRQQAKLCRVVQGEVLDVAVDVRRGSPYFGMHVKAILSSENRRQMYIPKGFAHGFAVLSDSAEFLYKCSDFYYREDERGVLWNDQGLGIDWDVDAPLLSMKDRQHPPLSRVPLADLPEYEGESRAGD